MIIKKPINYLTMLVCCFLLSACGGDGDTTTPSPELESTNTDCVLGTSPIGDCTL